MSGDGIPERFLIDFDRRDLLEASSFTAAFEHVQECVLPDRMKKAEEGKDADGNMRSHHRGFLDRWWRLSWDRAEMKAYFAGMRGRYIAASRTQSWPFVFCFMSTAIAPGDKLQIFAFDDDYSFGILQSSAHQYWYRAKAARLKNEKDFNYSTDSVFDTFPWPQDPSRAQVHAIARAARHVRQIRSQYLPKAKGGLRGLYHSLELPGANPLKTAHDALNAAVMNAYGIAGGGNLLAHLLSLNLCIEEKLRRGEKSVSPPGVPSAFVSDAEIYSTDCMGIA